MTKNKRQDIQPNNNRGLRTQIKAAFLVVFAFLIFFYLLSLQNIQLPDQKTIDTCKEYAPIRKEEYKDTKWKDIDFYQSCIDNIIYTSPLNMKGGE